MILALLAAGVFSLACAGAAGAGTTLWRDLADTSAVATADTWAVNPAAPAVDDSGRVAWSAASPRHHERRALALRRLASPEAPGDSALLARRWLMLSMPGVPGLPLYALRRAAPLFLAAAASVDLLTLSSSRAWMSIWAVGQLMGCSKLSSTFAYFDAQPDARTSIANAVQRISPPPASPRCFRPPV